MKCADCGKPVHPARPGGWCDEYGVQVYYHDSAVDSMLCLSAGPHVKGVIA